ncbi:MAG: glutamate--tRNA ligase [Phycisphaerae bacterium]|nr:glutamate--tRNA ligase [Phycisphaerae bacterium]
MDKLKTRFAPSPTGYLHVGGARTALFNYLLARRTGGTFLLRIEDTDQARHDESAVAKIVDDLRWLDLDWDEGVDVDPGGGVVGRGPAGPYRQSQRLAIYQQHVRQLLEAGQAYYAFETGEELDAMRQQARARKETFRYPRPERFPSRADAEEARAAGRPVAVRLAVPDEDVTIHDDAFGEVTMPATELSDFIIQKADRDGQGAWPTYHLANVVDDAMMGVNYICRGQEFLGQTWRHVVLRAALGFDEPGYCHLPLILDMEGRKLSKRDGAVEVHTFRQMGYLPEALVNFIALLGWKVGDRETYTLDELAEAFTTDGIGKSNAKFDRDKLLAFNADAVAAAGEDRLSAAFADYLSLNDEAAIPAGDEDTLRELLRACEGFRTFEDIVAKCGVLFEPDDAFAYDAKAVKKVLARNDGAGFAVLGELRDALASCDWSAGAIETLIREYAASHELGMGKVAQPLRVAVTGTTVSPGIGQTLELLGRDKTLARIDRCLREAGHGA